MNEDIKEILYCDVYNNLDDKKYEKLLNYITNLQEENNLLKAKIKCMEEKINYKKAYKDESEIYNEFFR